MSKKVLCVIRTSTIRQEIESQRDDMIRFLSGKGYQEDEIEWLESKGASARCANKAYLRMLDNIKAVISGSETINACAIWHLNRLGRIESYITAMREWFVNNRVQLYVKNPELTLLNPDGTYNVGNNIVFAVFAATIPAETEEMMEKLKRGKRRSREQGRYVGGFIPFGFKVVDGYQVVDEEKMALVKLVFEEYATGRYSYYKLQNELHSRNLGFTVRHLALLMSNEIYRKYVGDELWEQCERVRKGKEWQFGTKESKYCHLAAKLIRCPHCGATYIADAENYVCLNRKQGKRYGWVCRESISIKSDVVDTILWDEAVRHHRRYLMTSTADAVEENERKKAVVLQKIAASEENMAKIPEKLRRVNELYIDGALSRAEYLSRKKRLDAESDDLKSERKIYEDSLKRIEEALESLSETSVKAQIELLASAGDVASDDEKRTIVRLHIDHVSISETEHNGRKCILITVYDKYDGRREFIYDYNGTKKTRDIFQKLYRVTASGVRKYSYTGKTMSALSKEQLEGALD